MLILIILLSLALYILIGSVIANIVVFPGETIIEARERLAAHSIPLAILFLLATAGVSKYVDFILWLEEQRS
jgi:hypothetical protein